MTIKTNSRQVDIPTPPRSEIRRILGTTRVRATAEPLYLAMFEAGARAALEATQRSNNSRREEELMDL